MRKLDKHVLLVLCDEDEGNKDFLNGYKDISPDVQVISERILPQLRKQYELPVCKPGDLLIEDPFKNPGGQFMLLGSDTPEKLRERKLITIRRIAMILGATRCYVVNASGSQTTRNLDVIVNGKCEFANGEVDLKREDVEKAISKVSFEQTFPGKETLTDGDYFDAHEEAIANNLENDHVVRSLLDGRNPKYNMKSLRVEINTQNEINHLIDIAATCYAMDLFKAKCTYTQTLEYRTDYNLTLEFEFP